LSNNRQLQIQILLNSDFDVASAVVIFFIGFYGAYKDSDSIKTAYTTHYNKDYSGNDSKDFFKNPDERAEANKQQPYYE